MKLLKRCSLGVILGVVQIISSSSLKGETRDLFSMSLEELQQISIISATRKEQKALEAPAIIHVITKEDIQQWGYRSVAEALEQVPGFYSINDLFSHNVGVRGINAGLRSYGRIMKVMIDGMSIAFRSDQSNFLGPELIPVNSIERIEVVRGPLSSLYGANAFLGVVNIITSDPLGSSEKKVNARVESMGGRTGFLGGALYKEHQDTIGGLVAIDGGRIDRSGLQAPKSSPDFLFGEPEENRSKNDITRPFSYVGSAKWKVGDTQEGTLLSHFYRIDTVSQFLDFGTLSPKNRQVLEQGSIKLQHSYQFSSTLSGSGSIGYTRGGPGNQERLDLGSSSLLFRREFEFNEIDAEMVGRYQPSTSHSFSLGVDGIWDEEQLLELTALNQQTGEELEVGSKQGTKTLKNLGTFLQYIYQPSSVLGLTANIRGDYHNVYNFQPSYRLGVVSTPRKNLSLKLLYGTSYKAPAAMQLYAQPLYAGGVLGNPDLEVEKAKTLEFGTQYFPQKNIELNYSAYIFEVDDRIELLPFGPNEKPQNNGKEKGYGFEGGGKWSLGKSIFSASLAYQHTSEYIREPLSDEIKVPSSLYPRYSGRVAYELHDTWITDGKFGVRVNWASPRRASRQNANENLLTPYQVGSYALVNSSFQKTWNSHHFNLRVDNLLDKEYAEPGFGGIDIPGLKRTYMVQYSYSF